MRVITYGTFDLLHDGHIRLLQRAKALGDYLVVGVTTENFDGTRGKLNVRQNLMQRVQNVQATGLADEVIVEEYEGQKIDDIQRYSIGLFAIGSDWTGHFDYLNDFCQVVYLERTKGVSSTQLRNESGILRVGVLGSGRIARRMVQEARYVSGLAVEGVWSPTAENAQRFVDDLELQFAAESAKELVDAVDVVYIATPHQTHRDLAIMAMRAGRHVLCEKPLALTSADAIAMFAAARENDVVLLEAIKTAFSVGFQRMVSVARSGSIGEVRSVDATFTKLVASGRELDGSDGGSISELASYPLLAIAKLLGTDNVSLRCVALRDDHGVDTFARIDVDYPHAVSSARVGLGVKAEGELVVAGSKGYIVVPAPWWKTEYFETRFEDATQNRRYFYKFDGDGLRYEMAEFASLVREGRQGSYKLSRDESVWIAKAIEDARSSSLIIT